jgi:hypothetical protein
MVSEAYHILVVDFRTIVTDIALLISTVFGFSPSEAEIAKFTAFVTENLHFPSLVGVSIAHSVGVESVVP